MDYLLKLPPDLSIQFGCAVETMEEELHMPYVTSWEQHARQEGRQEGIREGVVELLLQALQIRFGEIPPTLLEKIEQCQDVDALCVLHEQVLTAESLDALQFRTPE